MATKKTSFYSCLLPLLLTVFLHLPLPVPAANFLYSICGNTTSYAKSTFGTNLRLLFDSLASNSTLSGGSFVTSVGQDPDKAYGRILCRGDTALDACRNCTETASREAASRCGSNRTATLWYDECLIRFSNTTISASSGNGPWSYMWNTQNVSDPDRFKATLGDLMGNLTDAAAYDARLRRFATGQAKFSSFSTVYGLVQCARDLSDGLCKSCLEEAVSLIPKCCDGKQGGRVLGTLCNLRYEIYSFYGASKIAAPSPSPVPTAATNQTTPIPGGKGSSKIVAILLSVSAGAIILIIIVAFFLVRKHCLKRKKCTPTLVLDDFDQSNSFLHIDLDTIRDATNDFDEQNKLGEGGFGSVYKGHLQDGLEVAVKRLSMNSGQGVEEFRNEVGLIAKLQHKNLVRLYGCCVEGQEKLLIYEYVPNRSLDYFLFDYGKRVLLSWERRFKIIGGIARGLLYLHEDSRLKIIHRDLKASNVLLDSDMNPKISDFGMAKIFGVEQTQGNTSRIAGTYGYMPPEYAIHGQFSVKSDVFSFGVLVLEIIIGQKNSSFYQSDGGGDILSYVWRAWKNGTMFDIIDPTIREYCQGSEVIRCIHIGLLCVQEDAASRPMMSSIVLMLNSFSVTVPAPSEPAFFLYSSVAPSLLFNTSTNASHSEPSHKNSSTVSRNDSSITDLEGR